MGSQGNRGSSSSDMNCKWSKRADRPLVKFKMEKPTYSSPYSSWHWVMVSAQSWGEPTIAQSANSLAARPRNTVGECLGV